MISFSTEIVCRLNLTRDFFLKKSWKNILSPKSPRRDPSKLRTLLIRYVENVPTKSWLIKENMNLHVTFFYKKYERVSKKIFFTNADFAGKSLRKHEVVSICFFRSIKMKANFAAGNCSLDLEVCLERNLNLA